MKYIVTIALYTFLLFSYIYQYDLVFWGIPEVLHSQRISCLAIVLLALCKRFIKPGVNVCVRKSFAYRSYKNYEVFIVLLLIYSCFLLTLLGEGKGVHIFDHILNITLFTLPTIWALVTLFEDISTFCIVILLTGVLQSVLILLCTFDDTIALAVDSTFNRNLFEFTRAHRYAYAGGIGCITSTGVVRFSTCLCSCIYFFYTTKRRGFLALFFILSIVASMVARTGLLFFFVGMAFLIANSGKMVSCFRLLVSSSFILVIILLIASQFIDLDELVSTRFNRFVSLSETGLSEGFFSGYFNGDDTYIPPFALDTLLGTGLTTGISSFGYNIHVDGGPLRIYSAIGLPMCIFVYTYLIRLMMKTAKMSRIRGDRLFINMIFVYLLIADFKELSLFQSWSMCFFFTTSILLYEKEENI